MPEGKFFAKRRWWTAREWHDAVKVGSFIKLEDRFRREAETARRMNRGLEESENDRRNRFAREFDGATAQDAAYRIATTRRLHEKYLEALRALNSAPLAA